MQLSNELAQERQVELGLQQLFRGDAIVKSESALESEHACRNQSRHREARSAVAIQSGLLRPDQVRPRNDVPFEMIAL